MQVVIDPRFVDALNRALDAPTDRKADVARAVTAETQSATPEELWRQLAREMTAVNQQLHGRRNARRLRVAIREAARRVPAADVPSVILSLRLSRDTLQHPEGAPHDRRTVRRVVDQLLGRPLGGNG